MLSSAYALSFGSSLETEVYTLDIPVDKYISIYVHLAH